MGTRCLLPTLLSLSIATAPIASAQQLSPPLDARAQVDRIFGPVDRNDGPGCAVGVAVGASTVLAAGYGVADLEHNVRITPNTVFETGSVAKQFTAAAVLLLAQQGKLSLDDPVRKYIPELPDYGTPITIRHLLNHTSGLRDWGGVAALSGRARFTTVAYSNSDVLQITARQRALNYVPGSEFSYTNTGYNLLAILVDRIEGKSLAQFSREAIFAPLGMTSSQWRDDFRRIVPNRAIAYARDGAGYRMSMPFETAHGNGGMLTTVGDLLQWNRNFAEMKVGGPAFVEAQIQQGRLTDGRIISAAAGLFVAEWRGKSEISHSGTTAGYNAWLARYPDQQLSVAILCNGPTGTSSVELGRQVADVYLTEVGNRRPPETTPQIDVVSLQDKIGLYHSTHDHMTLSVGVQNGGLRIVEPNGETMFTPVSDRVFTAAAGTRLEFERDALTDAMRLRFYGSIDEGNLYEKVQPAQPTRADLESIVGDYRSDEAETAVQVALDGDKLTIFQAPGPRITLTPTYQDGFTTPFFSVRFLRDSAGQVTEMSIGAQRVWDMRFQRIGTQGP